MALIDFKSQKVSSTQSEKRAFFLDLLPTAPEQPNVTIDDAGHFLQEEQGPTIAQHVLDFLGRTS